MPRAVARGDCRDRGRALLRARGRRPTRRSSARASRTSSRATRSRAARRSRSSSCARCTSRTRAQSFERKIREAKLAQELEDEHPGRAGKNWILREYLNSVPYGTNEGRTSIGVEAAAITYFAKHARNLELHESALLAGLPQAPSQYNPFRNPTRGPRAAQRGAEPDGRERLHHAPRGRAGVIDAARPQAGDPALHDPPRALLLRLRRGAADRGVRRGRVPPGRAEDPHDDRPGAPGRRQGGDQLARCPTRPTRARRSSRSTRPRATSRRWRRAARTRTARSTSPPRATASRARRSRPSCCSPR